jgi:hypothetical protein
MTKSKASIFVIFHAQMPGFQRTTDAAEGAAFLLLVDGLRVENAGSRKVRKGNVHT